MTTLKCYNCGRRWDGQGVAIEKVLCESCGQRWCFRNGALTWKAGVPKDAAGYVSTLHHVVAEVTNRLDAAGVFADTRVEETRERQTKQEPWKDYAPTLDPKLDAKVEALDKVEFALGQLRTAIARDAVISPMMKQVREGYEYTDVHGNRWLLRETKDERMPFTVHNIWRR